MIREFDDEFCRKYPKIFANRNKSMQETAMCWGFDCGNGWYHIIDNACALIQSHINWSREQRANDLKFNRALKKALEGNKEPLLKYYSHGDKVSEWALNSAEESIAKKAYREVHDVVPQVVADQIKEKFGTLRFYYHGGDGFVDGIVSMAEAMSAVTCEVCGDIGETNSEGWMSTLCDKHREKRNEETT